MSNYITNHYQFSYPSSYEDKIIELASEKEELLEVVENYLGLVCDFKIDYELVEEGEYLIDFDHKKLVYPLEYLSELEHYDDLMLVVTSLLGKEVNFFILLGFVDHLSHLLEEKDYYETINKYLINGEYLEITSLIKLKKYREEDVPLVINEAGAFVNYLIYYYGYPSFLRYYQGEAFKHVYGVDLKTMEKRFVFKYMGNELEF
ncbi:MAG: hypothetical protein PHY11_00780 [Bacilli bacterium]|nr:hypothetical protein [Bacilli bacterium]